MAIFNSYVKLPEGIAHYIICFIPLCPHCYFPLLFPIVISHCYFPLLFPMSYLAMVMTFFWDELTS